MTAGNQAVAAGAKYMDINNKDNSIEVNGGTPAGNTCPQFFFPTISTKLSATSISTGDSVSDSATLAGNSSNASGTVTYSVYSDSNCSTKFADGGTVNVTNGSVPNSNPVAFPNAGTFFWQASYSGDGTNAPAVSPCQSEQVVVNSPVIRIVKTPDAAQVNAGEPIGFTLTVFNTGAGNAKGVTLSDTLPTNAGLSWSIAALRARAGQQLARSAAGVLSCWRRRGCDGSRRDSAGDERPSRCTSPRRPRLRPVAPAPAATASSTTPAR